MFENESQFSFMCVYVCVCVCVCVCVLLGMENKFIVVCYSDLKRRFKVAVTDGNSCISLSSVQQFCKHANGIYYLEG